MKASLKFLCSCLLLMTLVSVGQANAVLKDMKGDNIAFSSLKGKWVLINYWASWCKSCTSEIPELNHFYEKHKKDVVLFAVNYDALSVEEQNALIKKFNIKYPSLSVDPAQVLGIEDIIGVPVTFLFNPQGKLTKTLYGIQTVRSLEKAIAKNK